MPLKLGDHNQNRWETREFSKESTIADLKKIMCDLFDLPDDDTTRIWNFYLDSHYELLESLDRTLYDYHLFAQQKILIEQKNSGGNWPVDENANSSRFSSTAPDALTNNILKYPLFSTTYHRHPVKQVSASPNDDCTSGQWQCDHCNVTLPCTSSTVRFRCYVCDDHDQCSSCLFEHRHQHKLHSVTGSGQWVCNVCDTRNAAWRFRCNLCQDWDICYTCLFESVSSNYLQLPVPLVSAMPPSSSTFSLERQLGFQSDSQSLSLAHVSRRQQDESQDQQPQQHGHSSESISMPPCVICLDQERSVLFRPCRHLIACATCATKLANCPICRVRIVASDRVFT
eukprot:m.131903 g.131903  ORF g.131903 m.131903 type:complete len:341 (-) comp23745_c0_seq8:37-1059(-)